MNTGPVTRALASPYMQWVKTQKPATYGLLTSGMLFCPMSFLGVRFEDLEINGPSFYGYEPLRGAVAEHCEVDTKCVVLAEGTSMANHLAMASLLAPGDEVLIEDPTYELLASLASYLGATIKRFPRPLESGFGVDLPELRRRLSPSTKLIVLTNLHNPSSAYLSNEVLRSIGDLARSVGAHVLVDEVYLDAKGPDVPRSAFHLGPEFVTTSSLTKVYGLNGLRCGWVLAQPILAEKMWKLNDLFGVIPAHPAELLGLAAFKKMGALRERTYAHLKANWESFDRLIRNHPAIEGVYPGFGTVLFPRLKTADATQFCEQLRARYDTSVVPGHFFGMKNHFRIGLGGEQTTVAKGLEQLKTALDAPRPPRLRVSFC